MLTLVIGGSGSGKSAYAESLLENFDGEKLYLATMQVYDEEGRRKVARHRQKRAGKGFTTVECCRDVGRLADRLSDSGHRAVLLECLTNLVANEMFGVISSHLDNAENRDGVDGTVGLADVTAEKIVEDIVRLCGKTQELVVVSGDVFGDGARYDEGTMAYMRVLADIHRELARRAERVVEVVVGIPVIQKDKSNDNY